MSEHDDARLRAARGDVSGALQVLDAILERAPDDAPALLAKAGLLLDGREGEQALSLYERATGAAPESAEAWNGLARCRHALGQDKEALAAAHRARELLPLHDNFRYRSSVTLTLVWCLRELRQYREALEVATQGLERSPDAILAQWASVVEEELAEAEKEGWP